MCTVTFIARRHGYALGMNRDELLSRVTAVPPARHRLGARAVLFPSEPGGGTWIGVNDSGVTLALINWYSVPARVTGNPISRGEVVKRSLPFDSPARVEAALAGLPLHDMNPFRLIGVFPAERAVVEWRWNLEQRARLDLSWCSNTWISSGFDEAGAQQTRGQVFRDAERQESVGDTDWLRRLHRSHLPERGPYAHCMHREDAATVSYTEVIVSRQSAALRYTPGAPCCTAARPPLRLQLDR